MSTKTRYEWDFERFEPVGGDVLDHDHRDRLRDFGRLPEKGERIVLVRDVICEFDGVIDRGWAYVEDGRLPEYFMGSDEEVRVPKKYHRELERWAEQRQLEADLDVLKYAGGLGHEWAVVRDTPYGRRLYAQCPTMESALRCRDEVLGGVAYRKSGRRWVRFNTENKEQVR